MAAMVLGSMMVILSAYWGYQMVPKYRFRETWFEDFSQGLDLQHSWNRETSVGGFGVTSFEWATNNDTNSFVRDGKLYIYPTLTPLPQVDGSFVNLTAEGGCSVPYNPIDCFAQFNSSRNQIINPVQSARLTTKGKRGLRYGKVEVRARLPTGDWLWPAIWLLPTNSEYGEWPASGEMDLVESRGNKPNTITPGGSNCLTGSIHWAPLGEILLATQDYFRVRFNCQPRESLADGFHTYGMEWTPQYVHYWLDNPIYTMFHWDFKEGPWIDGRTPEIGQNGGPIRNPWLSSNYTSAPFDKEFYLILNVAVGGTNGWFADSVGKPYSNSMGSGLNPWVAMRQFWKAQHKVLSMVISLFSADVLVVSHVAQ